MWRGGAQTAARHMRNLYQRHLFLHRTATAVLPLAPSRTCALNQEEPRSHQPPPPSRASPRPLPHSGFCYAAALGNQCTVLSGKPEIRGPPGSRLRWDALESRHPGQVVGLQNTVAARLEGIKKAQEPKVILQ